MNKIERAAYNRAYRKQHPNYWKIWQQNHKTEIAIRNKRYQRIHKIEIAAHRKAKRIAARKEQDA